MPRALSPAARARSDVAPAAPARLAKSAGGVVITDKHGIVTVAIWPAGRRFSTENIFAATAGAGDGPSLEAFESAVAAAGGAAAAVDLELELISFRRYRDKKLGKLSAASKVRGRIDPISSKERI